MDYTKALAILFFLPISTGFSQKSLDLDIFVMGQHVSRYPEFKMADSIPAGVELRNPKFHYYLHDDAKSQLFLGRSVNFILAAASLDEKIVSISVVIRFDSELQTDLTRKYGQWDTASRGSPSDDYDSLNTAKFSYYLWKLDDGSLNLSINRYMSRFGSGSDTTNDYAIISRRSKQYWDPK